MADAQTKTVTAKPEAELVPREGDRLLSSGELQQLDLFGNLKKKLSVEKFPGSIVLRRFHKGELICRQGDPGQSAFYIARSEDLRSLRILPAEEPLAETSAGPRRVATAHLLRTSQPPARPRGWLSRLWPARSAKAEQPALIPNDGPTDIDYRSRQAPMFEGDVFGEMSCMTLAPRSATIIADEDCWMVEFLRNIFDQMQRDDGYRERIDRLYEDRVLAGHLGRLEFFRDLTEAQLGILREAAHLEIVDPGMIICGEGDESDGVYLIRSGVVQVLRGADVTLRREDIADWQELCRSIAADGLADKTGQKKSDELGSSPLTVSPTPTAGKPSATDILAAARAKSAGKPKDLAKPDEGSQPAETKSTKPSAADILAATRASKSGDPSPVKDQLAKKPGLKSEISSSKSEIPNPKSLLFSRLPPAARTAIHEIAGGAACNDDSLRPILAALNEAMCDRAFLAAPELKSILNHPDVADTIDSFPKSAAGIAKDWSELEVRMAGRLVLRVMFADHFAKAPFRKGPPEILAYLTRGDCFGEMGLLLRKPRQATCIAYDHPSDDPRRKPGRVELVRIDGSAFQRLHKDSPQLKASVEALVAQRRQQIEASDVRPPWDSRHSLTETDEFRDAGLIQGQKLLLIDLDRCTRCGDCVRACINTHDDGYSRLFLDGPRFDRFLVPSACRQCLNPSCMIGCPVGSIQRGDNGQIEIRDWCIGCSLCARQCPYDSIQMHDVGIIPEQAAGWTFAPASAVSGDDWQQPRYRPRHWASGITPLRWTIDLHDQLASRSSDPGWQDSTGLLPEPICLRYSFNLTRDEIDPERFRLQMSSAGLRAEMWLNGESLSLRQDERQAKKGEFEAVVDGANLRRGANLLAVRLSPPADTGSAEPLRPKYDATILSLRLDPIPHGGELSAALAQQGVELEIESVTQRAVVCDLCSSLPNREPACVAMCPHDAAIRVNARYEFPVA